MPRLMEKKDWMQTLADVGSADDVWFENVAGDACTVSLSLPEAGRYRVIFVKLDGVPRCRHLRPAKEIERYLRRFGLFAAQQG